jgi:hypothetical protein
MTDAQGMDDDEATPNIEAAANTFYANQRVLIAVPV